MEIFEKVNKVARNVGDNVENIAKNVGNAITNVSKEQSELASLNVQKNVITKKLESSYAEIGKRYVDFVENCREGVTFEVDDIIEKMRPELDKLAELKLQIEEKELKIKQNNIDKAFKKAQDEYDTEKKKLDKAMEIDIISQEEYDEKLDFAKKKLDNFELLRKVQMQYDMDIITKEEYNEKVKKILE